MMMMKGDAIDEVEEKRRRRKGEEGELTANDDDCDQYYRTHICGVEK
jgi:hypothetical protein